MTDEEIATLVSAGLASLVGELTAIKDAIEALTVQTTAGVAQTTLLADRADRAVGAAAPTQAIGPKTRPPRRS